MIKNVCMVMGAILTLVGIVGFFTHELLGMHLGTAHNVVHLLSGLAAIYCGYRSELAARRFCQIFGAVYGLLGIVGFFFGSGTFTVPEVSGMTDSHLMKVIPGTLELGTPDHVVHILLGVVFCALGFMPLGVARRVETTAETTRERVTP